MKVALYTYKIGIRDKKTGRRSLHEVHYLTKSLDTAVVMQAYGPLTSIPQNIRRTKKDKTINTKVDQTHGQILHKLDHQ